jgi:hypothetical protein
MMLVTGDTGGRQGIVAQRSSGMHAAALLGHLARMAI